MTSGSDYDVVVIGGGIHGAGVTQVFAVNRFRVLLLERYTIASQTSSRSSKLIHGGLRYLETLQLRLVRECLREREILLRIAPELVRLVPFYIPVYDFSTRGRLTISTGLALYALLGGLGRHFRFQRCRRADWSTLDGLRTEGLRAVYRYYDAQTDDLRLTRAVLHSAVSHGAGFEEHAEFLHASVAGDKWRFRYRRAGQERECQARLLVNATGPWVRYTAQKITAGGAATGHPELPRLSLVQGTHIEVPRTTTKGIYYLESPQDRRAVFVMPWGARTLVGTTETELSAPLADPAPQATEIDYLLRCYNHYFEPVEPDAVVRSFAGIRVLPQEQGSAFRRSRDTRLIAALRQAPGVVHVCGGKLTAYRHTAVRVYRLCAPLLGADKDFVDTAQLPLQPAD